MFGVGWSHAPPCFAFRCLIFVFSLVHTKQYGRTLIPLRTSLVVYSNLIVSHASSITSLLTYAQSNAPPSARARFILLETGEMNM